MGAVAAGHSTTAEAARLILQEGGNAFDAAISAMLTACVAEPILASPGGGGFLTAHPVDADPLVYDFFAQTPHRKRDASEIDLYPIVADFGDANQSFHIGMGSIATPGFVGGVFAIHRELASLPLQRLFEPAIELARSGVPLNPFQHLIAQIVAPILRSTDTASRLWHASEEAGTLPEVGTLHHNPQLADLLEALQREGEALFYRGEPAQLLVRACRENGGHLLAEDLEQFEVIRRSPLRCHYQGAQILTNPLPSLGGSLIHFSLQLLEPCTLGRFSAASAEPLRFLARSMRQTQLMRQHPEAGNDLSHAASLLQAFQSRVAEGGISSRGTTQVSIADRDGNLASLTLSNGEGCGYIIPNTGVMLNNMLGEEDLNPLGFNQWPKDQRIASMMAPTLLMLADGRRIVTGSGGSNRIRSAILQVISNLIDFEMPLAEAVAAPRIHLEGDLLSIEPGLPAETISALEEEFPQQELWKQKSLFFGGTHSVALSSSGEVSGAGDERRGGVWLSA
ncbi:gamma-glutamyltransferase/Threonine peptidase/MEROPS family T03 [endosymbiont of Ridgeia piscesae]|jgi:gamma-glutamyltranspeptidase/glutathione hydrolase|uniref:Gamma-glutamyltransferase/Threonine peptidase/MEROPS family T03 n=3 Tax=endosymbiont of Ridgeia piscesae TaxID=54398 RepID=A0A0T5YUA3_9GAMM|nr:gamma-glutamyltransferase [endosymbiont of Ridgeia piscesae]KRT54153.1 gamma-glutamyltransferase/Threonine peptidase/MEROPS family T03 [endosymbiont of Ridgeia piscesae]